VHNFLQSLKSLLWVLGDEISKDLEGQKQALGVGSWDQSLCLRLNL
jgi:hypothetical protein